MLVVRSICRSYCAIPCMTTFSVLCGTNHVPRTSYRFLGRAHLAASLVFYILLVKHVNALAPVNNISYTNKNKLEFEKRNTRLKLIDLAKGDFLLHFGQVSTEEDGISNDATGKLIGRSTHDLHAGA